MDKTDNKIMDILDVNPKMPLSAIAKKVRISQQVTDYRVKRLISEGKILKFATLINLKALGYEQYRVFLRFNARKNTGNSDVFDYLKKQPGIYWTARIGGQYDLVIILAVQDLEEFDHFLENFNSRFPQLIRDYKSCYMTEHIILRHKYISHDSQKLSYGYNDKKVLIDQLDMNIIQEIKDDCRISSLKLAKRYNVSYKTILNRIKSLEAKKIIMGYRLYFKSQSTQKPFILLFSFKDFGREKENAIVSYASQHDLITQIIRLFGIWDLFLHVRSKSNEEVQSLIIELRDKFDIIDNFEIIPVFEDIAIDLCPTKRQRRFY